jgi:hypothetical protein
VSLLVEFALYLEIRQPSRLVRFVSPGDEDHLVVISAGALAFVLDPAAHGVRFARSDLVLVASCVLHLGDDAGSKLSFLAGEPSGAPFQRSQG